MCGIFGYVGSKDAPSILLEGLEKLAYRGYDSAGLAVLNPLGKVEVRKASGKLENLAHLVQANPLKGTPGLGHTRWATHGQPNDVNAHPHLNRDENLVVVHNGIVENYIEIKKQLTANGHQFKSDTDTEVIPLLISEFLTRGNSFEEAVRLAAKQLQGPHAIACIFAGSPGVIAAVRIGNAGGLSIGHGEGESFLASDLPPLLPHTTSVTTLSPGEMAILRQEGPVFYDLQGKEIEIPKRIISVTPVSAAKGGFPHFMLKEIMEQPEAAMSALRGRLSFSPEALTLDEIPWSPTQLGHIRRAVFLGMGTSLNTTLLGARFMESIARIPATAENAAEFRYRDPVLDEQTLVVAVTQSGETADTLAALHEARKNGAKTLAITNAEGSQATRTAEGSMLMHAGLEIGVASTKTAINSILCMYLLSGYIAGAKGKLLQEKLTSHVEHAARLPGLLAEALELNQDSYLPLAAKYSTAKRFLFLGRGLLEPIAREGALKLKEISYIHAEGMPAAEMKHGPIALIDRDTPVVAFALRDGLYEKMLGNISEVRARGGPVIAIATQGDETILEYTNDVLWTPEGPDHLAAIATIIPAQLFAYNMAVHYGNDVDQPRNLAKSVTVE